MKRKRVLVTLTPESLEAIEIEALSDRQFAIESEMQSLKEIYLRLCERFGSSDANNLFHRASKRPNHREKGNSDKAVDEVLYAICAYALLASGESEKIPRDVAEDLHSLRPGYFGNSSSAIEKRIRRLGLIGELKVDEHSSAEVLRRITEWVKSPISLTSQGAPMDKK